MENLVLIQDNKVIVTSRMVAETFGKEHSKVQRSIKEILEETGNATFGDTPLFHESFYKDQWNRYQTEYIMGRDGFTILSMGFTGSKAMQWKLAYINAFNEMEEKLKAQSVQALPTTYIEALEALLASEKAKALMTPKAEYYDGLVERGLSLSFRETAKELKVGERKMIEWLLEKGYVYRDQKGKLTPYAKWVDKGYFEIKEFNTGSFASTQTLVTVTGRENLRTKVGK